MPKKTKKIHVYGFSQNRKLVIEDGDIRLLIRPKMGRARAPMTGVCVVGTKIEIERRKVGTRATWVPLWSGVASNDNGAATIETL